MIYWSCNGCTLIFTAELSSLECDDSLIREVTVLRNEIALIKKPNFPFLRAAKDGPARNRNDSSSSSKVNKKRKADEFETVQRIRR